MVNCKSHAEWKCSKLDRWCSMIKQMKSRWKFSTNKSDSLLKTAPIYNAIIMFRLAVIWFYYPSQPAALCCPKNFHAILWWVWQSLDRSGTGDPCSPPLRACRRLVDGSGPAGPAERSAAASPDCWWTAGQTLQQAEIPPNHADEFAQQ